MMNQDFLEKHYKENGYKNLGWVNISTKAQEAYSESEQKQWHEIGRNLHLVALHDLKAFVLIDSGD
jgi:hypothetical protein